MTQRRLNVNQFFEKLNARRQIPTITLRSDLFTSIQFSYDIQTQEDCTVALNLKYRDGSSLSFQFTQHDAELLLTALIDAKHLMKSYAGNEPVFISRSSLLAWLLFDTVIPLFPLKTPCCTFKLDSDSDLLVEQQKQQHEQQYRASRRFCYGEPSLISVKFLLPQSRIIVKFVQHERLQIANYPITALYE